MRKPVTAIIPVRNGSKWINSFSRYLFFEIREQDEVIFVDDNSTDNSLALLKEVKLATRNLVVLENSGSGLVSALNLALRRAKNEWVARFDIDDAYVLGRLDSQLALIGPETGLVFGDYEFYGDGIEPLGILPSAIWDLPTRVSLYSSQRTPHPIALFKKNVAIEAGLYKEEDFPAEDLGLWLRMAKISKIETIPIVLLNYNLRRDSVSASRYLEIKSKTREVIKRYSLDISSEELTLKAIRRYSKKYSEYRLGSERKVLFYVDILRYLKSHGNLDYNLVRFLILSVFIFMNPKNFLSLIRLILQRKKRNRFRRLRSV